MVLTLGYSWVIMTRGVRGGYGLIDLVRSLTPQRVLHLFVLQSVN